MIEGDTFQKFLFDDLQIRGEWLRLDTSFKQVIKGKAYPTEISKLLGEAIAATVLMTGTLKFDGRLSMHARGAGSIDLLMAEATNKRKYRGIAHYDEHADLSQPFNKLLGRAQLAITIEPNIGARYQGIVPLERVTIADCLAHYFELSEQLDTCFILQVEDGAVFGLMLQKLPDYRNIEDQDAWNRILQLAQTLEFSEAAASTNEVLTHRLFHEEQVRLYSSEPVAFECSCSTERSLASIEALGSEEALQILETEKVITVDCQFCNQQYRFDRNAILQLFKLGTSH